MTVALTLDWENYEVLVPVVIEIEPERIHGVDPVSPGESLRMSDLVARGLRAKLGHGNLLTGQLQVELDLHPDAPPAQIVLGGEYPELPTVQTTLGGITSNLTGVLAKLEAMPFAEIGANVNASLIELRRTLDTANTLMVHLNAEIVPSLASTMLGVERAVGGVDALLAVDSPAPRELQRALEEFGDAAHSVRMLVDYLERHPEALLRGKRGN